MLEKLKYRIKSFFCGETGIVEKVENISLEEKNRYVKDYSKNYPSKVKFRNPLGDLVTKISPMKTEIFLDRVGFYHERVYKKYKIRDKFP